jgi:hippurate hydrolase
VNKDVFEESKKENIPLPSLHSDLFLPDAEPTINTGITAMSQAAIDLFREEL